MKILRGTLTFVLGMIIGILLFVLAIGGTVVIIGTAMTIDELQTTIGVEIFDKDSELSSKTILDAIKMVMGDVQQFDSLTIQTLIDKYGLPIPSEISGIDISEAFKYPIVELGDHVNEIVNSISLGEIGTAFDIDFGDLPILNDNLDKGISDVVNTLLASINGDMTLRAIKTNFGIDIGVDQNSLLKNLQDAPFGNLGAIINGMYLDSLLDASTDTYVKTISLGYKAVDVYEEVSAADLANTSYTAPLGVDTYIENGVDANGDGTTDTLFERELRFVKVTTSSGEVKYNVDNSCYQDDFDAQTNEKTFYRHVSYQLLSATEAVDGTNVWIEAFGNKVVSVSGTDYTLYSKGFVKASELVAEGIVSLERGNTGIIATGDEYGVVDEQITTSSKLDEAGTGYILAEVGTSPAVLQSVAFLTVNELQSASDFITSLKLCDVLDIDENSAQILQALKDSTLGSISNDIGNITLGDAIKIDSSSPQILQTLKDSTLDSLGDDINDITLGEVIEIDENSPQILQTLSTSTLGSIAEDIEGLTLGEMLDIDENSAQILQALKDSTIDTIAEDINDITLGEVIEIDENSPQILQTLQDSTLGTLSDSINDLKLGDAITIVCDTYAESENGKYAKVDDGTSVYYTLYNEAVHNGTPRYECTAVSGSSSKILQRFANTSINDFASAFDDLILGDVMDIDPDVLETVSSESADDNSISYYYYDSEKGLYRLASATDIAKNEYVYKVVENGESSAMLKKLAFVQVSNLSTAIEDIMDDMLLGDVMDIVLDEFVEDENGRYALVQDGASSYYTLYNAAIHSGAHYKRVTVHGSSSKVLQRFKDVSISQFATAFDDLTLGDVLDIDTDLYEKVDQADTLANTSISYYYYDSEKGLYRLADATYISQNEYVYAISSVGESSAMLKKLAFVKVSNLSTAIEDIMDDMLLGDVMDIVLDEFVEDENGRYALVQDGASSYYTLYNAAIHSGAHYKRVTVDGSSSKVLQRFKDVSISQFANAFDDLTLGDVLDIDTDLYEKVTQAYALADTSVSYYYYDSEKGLYRLADATYISQNEYVYVISSVGESSTMLKKLAFVKVSNLSTAMDDIMDDMLLGDVMDIVEDNYTLDETGLGRYVLVQEGANSYYTLYNEALHEGLAHYTKEDVDGSSSKVLQRLKNVSIGNFASAFEGLTLGDVLDIDTDLYAKVAQADALASTDEIYYYFDRTTGLYRLADDEYIGANEYVYKVSASGESASIIKKLAFVKIDNLSSAMEDIMNDLFITDLIDVYSHYVVKESETALSDKATEDTFLIGAYLENGEYVLQNGKKITYIYDTEGRYIQRSYKFVETAPSELTTTGTITYKYSAFDTLFVDGSSTTVKQVAAAAQVATGNVYYFDGTSYVYNIPLATYLVSQGKFDKLYYRASSTDADAIVSNTYSNDGTLYVLSATLGQYVPYDSTSLVDADNEAYYVKKTAQDGEYYFVNIADPLPSDDAENYIYKEGVDNLFSKQYCEDIYVESAEGEWVYMGGRYVQYDQTNHAHATLTRYDVKLGYITTLYGAYYTYEGVLTSVLEPLKVDVVHEKSANVLNVMADSKVTVDKMSDVIENATIDVLMEVQPDTIFDSSMFVGVAINDMGTIFSTILKDMTIGQLLEWGNFTSIDQRVKDALESVTFENFIDSLVFTEAGIVVDMEIALGYAE